MQDLEKLHNKLLFPIEIKLHFSCMFLLVSLVISPFEKWLKYKYLDCVILIAIGLENLKIFIFYFLLTFKHFPVVRGILLNHYFLFRCIVICILHLQSTLN